MEREKLSLVLADAPGTEVQLKAAVRSQGRLMLNLEAKFLLLVVIDGRELRHFHFHALAVGINHELPSPREDGYQPILEHVINLCSLACGDQKRSFGH